MDMIRGRKEGEGASEKKPSMIYFWVGIVCGFFITFFFLI
jgi:hypothetical protein